MATAQTRKPSHERIEHLFRQMRAVGSLQPDAFSDLDLTITQLKVLALLKASQPVTVTAVAQTLDVTMASASARVDRLVREGLILRSENPDDRRQLRLRLSRKGEDLLGKLERRSDEDMRRALDLMTPAGLAALEIAMEDMLRAFALLAAEKTAPAPARGARGARSRRTRARG